MSTIDEKETRTDRTANSELDSLIEEAVIENCARKRLHSLENEIRRRERKSRTLRRIFLWAGGAVSAAAVISAVVISTAPTQEQIQRGIELSERHMADDGTYRDAGDESDIEKQINRAKEELASGNYKECRKSLSDAKLRIGQILTGNDSTSISEIERVFLVQMNDKADWYIAVSWLKQGKPRKAKRPLRRIASGNGLYADDARSLLQEIYD